MKSAGTRVIYFLYLFLLLFFSCSPISEFSPYAYRQAVSLKVESLALMEQAENSFRDMKAEVDNLKLELSKAYEYSKGRPHNEISTKQWEILIDPERNLLGGFLKRWETQDSLAQFFINEAMGLVSDAFDTIISLESGKVKPSDISGE
jgi:hypothetical protein